MTTMRFDDLRQYSDLLRSGRGHAVTVRFVEPRDAEALQNYFRSLTTRSRYHRLRRQRQRAILADEQPKAEFFLQPLDLMADRGLRDVQLGRRLRETQMPGGSLEGAQSIQRRQPGGHSPIPRYMSLCHVKRHKVSFVEGPDSADISCIRLPMEIEMSTCTHEAMINHHGQGLLSNLNETLHVWRRRYESRRELAQWSDRDLHDIGVSSSDVLFETSKPFWQA